MKPVYDFDVHIKEVDDVAVAFHPKYVSCYL
jgi:hypothetical protein